MAGYQFAFFHFNFLVRTITMEGSAGPRMCDVNAGTSPLRRSLPFFQVAAKRLGILYLSSCRSCGDSLCAGPGAMMMLCAGEPSLRAEFLSCGMGRAILHEVATAASKRTALKLLTSIPLSEWQNLPIPEAALLAGDLAAGLMDRQFDDDYDYGDSPGDAGGATAVVEKILDSLFRRQTLDGLQPTRHAAAIMNGLLSVGRTCEATTRAFFHYVIEEGKEKVFKASEAIEAWKKMSDFCVDRKSAAYARYLRHMEAVMDKRERAEEWDFLFEKAE